MINFNSGQQLSALLFGGKIKVKKRVPVLNELGVHEQVKNGKTRGALKYRNIEEVVVLKGLGFRPSDDWKLQKEGHYQTDEKVLNILRSKAKGNALKIITWLLELKKLSKLKSTYYKGFKKFIYPDGRIHGCIDHVNNITGRTNSSKPNLQNTPRS